MLKLNKWVKSLITAGAVFSLMAPLQAETTLKLATVAPDKSPWHKHIQEFVTLVEASDAGIKIEYFGNAQLGNMPDTLKSTLSGRVDIWVGAMPVLSAVTPEFSMYTMPYMFNDLDEVKCVVPAMAALNARAAGKKYQLLDIMPVGTQGIAATKAIRTPADMEGVKIRTAPIKSSMNFFHATGATPQPLPASETPGSLSTGLVNAADFASPYLVLTGSHKIAKNYTETDHNYNLGNLIISARSWKKLSDKEKAALQEAAAATDFSKQVDEIAAFEKKMLGAVAKQGGELVELSDEEMAGWKAVGDKVRTEMIAEMDSKVGDFAKAIDAARAECAK